MNIKLTKISKKWTKKNTNKSLCNEKIKIFIIDYANVIYTLFEEYQNYDEVVKKFHLFLSNQLKKKNIIFVVSKLVIIQNKNYDIKSLLSRGEVITKTNISNKYFKNKQLNIIQLQYPIKISSSTDDLMFWYISTQIWFDVCNKPRQNMYFVTNDKQYSDKNLFGETVDERTNDISISKDLKIMTVDPLNNYEYKPLSQFKKLPFYFNKLVDTVAENNSNLECYVSLLLEMLMNKKKLYGKPYQNPNFKSLNFTRKNFPSLRYKELNNMKKDTSFVKKNKSIISRCKFKQLVSNKTTEKLKESYYLYALIKYMQMYT